MARMHGLEWRAWSLAHDHYHLEKQDALRGLYLLQLGLGLGLYLLQLGLGLGLYLLQLGLGLGLGLYLLPSIEQSDSD